MIVLILFNLSIFNDSQLGEKLSTLDVIGNENIKRPENVSYQHR